MRGERKQKAGRRVEGRAKREEVRGKREEVRVRRKQIAAMVGRRDPRRRVSVSPTTAERAKINAVGRNRVTTAVARVARPYHRVTAAERVGFLAHGGARSQDDWGRGGKAVPILCIAFVQ